MVILHGFFALLAGFAVMAVLLIAVTALLTFFVPEWVRTEGRPGPGAAFVTLGYSFLAAAAGGYVTARIAAASPLVYILALALAVLVLAALSALQARGRQPIWYQLLLAVISPLGVVAGGLICLRVLGVL